MALTEAEELELLELEEQEAFGSQNPEPDYGSLAADAVKTAFTGHAGMVGQMLKHPEKLTGAAPVAGGIIGGSFGGVGAPIGVGLGAIVQRMGDIAFNQGGPVGTPMREAIGPMAQTAMAGLPEVGGVKKAIQNVVLNHGTRALGFTKRMLKLGGEAEAKATAQTMLDRGVIRPLSGSKATLGRAEDLADVAGETMEQAGQQFAKKGLQPIDTNQIGLKISEQLTPKYSGGAYEAEKKVVGEILDTVGAHGNGPIDFASAQALKQKLQELGKFNSLTDATKSNLYRRASGIVREAIDDAVAKSGGPASAQYLGGKKLYGQASRAIEGLTDKVSAQAANNPVGPYGVAMGAARLVAGDVTGGLAAMGFMEGVKRVGSATTASTLNALNNTFGGQTARRALLTQLVDRVITNRDAQRYK